MSEAEIEEQRVCRHCGRPLVAWEGAWIHATPWVRVEGSDEGQRELYRYCRRTIAEPIGAGETSDDEIEREVHLTAYFAEAGMDWRAPDPVVAAGLVAFRAGWRAARS